MIRQLMLAVIVLCSLGGAGAYLLRRPAPALSRPPAPQTVFADAPPPGLPIVAWGQRHEFPVIREPQYVSAAHGDQLLAADEPVLGLVLNGVARAYSTNQLNEHEMVLDKIAGTPVLVTY